MYHHSGWLGRVSQHGLGEGKIFSELLKYKSLLHKKLFVKNSNIVWPTFGVLFCHFWRLTALIFNVTYLASWAWYKKNKLHRFGTTLRWVKDDRTCELFLKVLSVTQFVWTMEVQRITWQLYFSSFRDGISAGVTPLLLSPLYYSIYFWAMWTFPKHRITLKKLILSICDPGVLNRWKGGKLRKYRSNGVTLLLYWSEILHFLLCVFLLSQLFCSHFIHYLSSSRLKIEMNLSALFRRIS